MRPSKSFVTTKFLEGEQVVFLPEHCTIFSEELAMGDYSHTPFDGKLS